MPEAAQVEPAIPDEPIRSYTQHLPCTLTAEEHRLAGAELGKKLDEIQSEERRAADVKAQLKARMTSLESQRSELQLKVNRREELRDVKVSVFLCDDNLVREIREDTGEVIHVRTPTEIELQGELDLDGDEDLEGAEDDGDEEE